MRWFRSLAIAVGAVVLAVAGSAVLAVAGRWLQVKLFAPAPSAERAAEKAAYLQSRTPVDPDEAPNFVIVLFDDLGWGDLSVYGNRLIDTPRIDALAEEGVLMTDFYAASPVCTPSRAALLTGRYPVRAGAESHVFFPEGSVIGTLRRMAGLPNEMRRDEITLPEALRAAGYATGMIGKWHLGETPGHRPNDLGFDSFYGVLWSNDMQPLDVWRDAEVEIEDTTSRVDALGSYRDEEAPVERRGGVDQEQLTRLYTEEAVRFIEQHRDEPFLLYVAHTFPHVPHFADPAHAGQSRGGLYGDVVQDLDRSTGAIVEAIDRLGLAERTLVIVTSDNGADYGGSPGPLRGRKGDTYEGGQRVPLVARWPGRIPAGVRTSEMGMNVDFLPTLLGYAGVGLPADRLIDGRDLAGVWEAGAPGPHEFLFYFRPMEAAPIAVRDRRFKYLAETGDLGRSKPTLTSLEADAESHDLSRRHPRERARLSAALDEMRAAIAENPRGWR